MRLKGVGEGSAWLWVMEFFAWWQFRNRCEVGALSGRTPTPYQSGDDSREQGISKGIALLLSSSERLRIREPNHISRLINR